MADGGGGRDYFREIKEMSKTKWIAFLTSELAKSAILKRQLLIVLRFGFSWNLKFDI